MAIITISRQVAARGDEIAQLLADKLNYQFIKRTDIEKRIVDLGFPESKMPKYDERKPGFFASLAKDRDEYLNYVQYAILEAAAKKNTVIIGRGAFATLQNVPNAIAVRLVANEAVRIERLKKEFNWNEKQALQRIQESDTNRIGYHNNFYNVNIEDATLFNMILNTGLTDDDSCAEIIAKYVQTMVTPEKEAEGNKKIELMLKCQEIVNKLTFEHDIAIEFMHIVVEDKTVILQGVSQSAGTVEKALRIMQEEMPGYEAKSAVSIVHDFKTFQ